MAARSGAFFNEFADVFDTFYDGKRSYAMQWIDRRFRSDMFVRFEKTFAFLGDLNGLRVLDVGCGSGPYLAEALRRGAAHVTGLDAASRMLELARQRARALGAEARTRFVNGYFPEACPDETYDYAIVMGVLDYVADPETFLRRLAAAVTRGAVLSFPSRHWLRTPVRKVRYRLRHCPVWFYSERDLRRLLERSGIHLYTIDKIPGAGMDFVVSFRHGAD